MFAALTRQNEFAKGAGVFNAEDLRRMLPDLLNSHLLRRPGTNDAGVRLP